MNIFRITGDMMHVASKLILLMQLYRSRNARGISVKTQELYLIVFCMRYLDLLTSFYSLYNSFMKIFYIFVSALIICKIKYLEPIKSVYNADQDSFPHWTCAVLPSLMLGFAITAVKHSTNGEVFMGSTMLDIFMECLWTTSLFLESIAILPQLFVLRRFRLVENLTGKFMLCLGSYRVLYMMNWLYRSQMEPWYQHNYILSIAGIFQACMYLDFFIQYVKISSPCCGGGKRNNENDDDNEGLIFEISRTQQQQSIGEVASDPLLIEAKDVTATSKDLLVERRSRFTAEGRV